MKFQVEFDGTLKDDIKLSDSQYDLRITDFVISNKPFINVKMKMYKNADSKCTILASRF